MGCYFWVVPGLFTDNFHILYYMEPKPKGEKKWEYSLLTCDYAFVVKIRMHDLCKFKVKVIINM